MIALWLGAALAADVASVQICPDAPDTDVAWAMQRTVQIKTPDGLGAGVLISQDGLVLTAAHVVAGASERLVRLHDGRELSATITRMAEDADLALLSIPGQGFACAPINPMPLPVGSDVLVIGSPSGLSQSVTKGIVSSYREVNGHTVLQTDATINAGNSGGPIFGPDGTLVAVVSYKMVGQGIEGLGFGVASNNFGPELDLRWGSHTDPSLLTAPIGILGSLSGGLGLRGDGLRLPEITPGPGVVLATDGRYQLAYRPRRGALIWGSLFAGVGAALSVSSWNRYKTSEGMTEERWRSTKSTNILGGTSFLFGSGIIALGLRPAKNAPVVPIGDTP